MPCLAPASFVKKSTHTVTVPNMVVQTDPVIGCASMPILGLAEEHGFAVLLTDMDIARALVEGHCGVTRQQ